LADHQARARWGEFVAVVDDVGVSGSAGRHDFWVGVVDDDESIRTALARVLRGNGISVQTFGSAEEFLFRAVRSQPECIVLDIHLGEMSGFELRDRLASDGTLPPIIFITGHDDMPAERARSGGSCGFLRKPFDTSDLVALLRPHLHSTPK
jgi:FixJ family two-component response regulator